MVKFCALRACPNRDLRNDKNSSVTHHGFPRVRENASQWVDLINKHNRSCDFKAVHRRGAYLCSAHFEQSWYKSRKFLKNDAIPTMFPKFTAEVAMKFNLIPTQDSALLNTVNDFNLSVEEYLKIAGEYPESLMSQQNGVDIVLSAEPVGDAMDVDANTISATNTPCQDNGVETTPAQNSGSCSTNLSSKGQSCPCPPQNGSASEMTAGKNTPLNSADLISPEPSTSQSAEPKTPVRGKRKFHVGDVSPSDVASPCRAKIVVEFLKNSVTGTRKSLKATKMRLKRALHRVNDLQSLLQHLKHERKIPQEVASLIEVGVKSVRKSLTFDLSPVTSESDEEEKKLLGNVNVEGYAVLQTGPD